MIIPQTMLQIIQSGANLTIDLNKQIVIPQIMLQLANAAAISGAKITFKNCDGKIIPHIYIQVAEAGRGQVTFEQ